MKTYKIKVKNSVPQNDWPKRYRCEYIEPGIISYEDVGAGVLYVGSEALDKMQESFIGKPVVNEEHLDLTANEAFKLSDKDRETLADGIVYSVGKLSNGWYYNDMLIWDKETQRNIDEKNYSVSCAYVVDQVGPEGSCHGVRYDEEVLNGTYTHNAIVKNPRYEGSKIYELKTKENESSIMEVYKNCKGENMFFKHLMNSVQNKKSVQNTKNSVDPEKKDTPPEKEKENSDENSMMNMEGAMIEVEGESIPLEEAVNAYRSMKENQDQEDQIQKLNMEDEVDVDGTPVKCSELVAAYKGMKQNAETPQDVQAEEVVEEQQAVQNSKKKNHFKIVKNAAKQTQEEKVYVNTRDDRIQRGKKRYGSLKKEV